VRTGLISGIPPESAIGHAQPATNELSVADKNITRVIELKLKMLHNEKMPVIIRSKIH